MEAEYCPKRVTRTFSHEIAAPAANVFPLLCPTREYEWLPGWSCEMVYSESGHAELGCVFQTDDRMAGKKTWVVSRYEPHRLIGFVVVVPDMLTEQLEVRVDDVPGRGCKLTWTRTFTTLSKSGDGFIAHVSGGYFDALHAWLGEALDEYATLGKITKKSFPF